MPRLAAALALARRLRVCGRSYVDRLELAGLELAGELRVDLGVLGRRLAMRELLSLQLELAPALQLQDLEHEHEVDARREREQAEARHHERPADVEVAVVVAVRDE